MEKRLLSPLARRAVTALTALLCTVCCLLSASAAPRVREVVIGIESDPLGARVYIDGRDQGMRGTASAGFTIGLKAGPHKVLLELDGYATQEQTILVDKRQKFVFQLKRAPAKLDVRLPAADEGARGAELFVDGTPMGPIPREIELTEGPHLIEVRKPGYEAFTDRIDVRPAERRPYLVVLKAEQRLGTLLVTATGNGEVYVDGRHRGPAPQVIEKMAEGEHQVEVRRSDGEGAPWTRNVKVIAGQQVTVQAELPAPPSKSGSLLLLIQVPESAAPEVTIDGTGKGRPNVEIADLRPGQHVVQVQAKGYAPVTKLVEVEAGRQRVERIEMQLTAEGRGAGWLRVLMVNPVDGAQYFINGKPFDATQLLSDRGIEVSAGPAVVLVRREGFEEVRKSVTVPVGGTATVEVELRNVGRLRVDSMPPGATVLIDRVPVGQTPLAPREVPAGPHMVEIQMQDMEPYVEQVEIRGGGPPAVVSIQLRPALGPTSPAKLSFSSLSALSQGTGRFGVDVAAGYPYFLSARLMVGAFNRGMFGFDVGPEIRTLGYSTEFNALLRAQLFRAGPLALGLNLLIGGGVGPRQRDTFNFEVGVPVTLVIANRAHLTLRPYVQVYSDRLCPSEAYVDDPKNTVEPEHSGDRCYQAMSARRLGAATSEDKDVLGRFGGGRFLLQAVLEANITPTVSVFGLIEGVPYKKEREMLTDQYNRIFQITDFPLYGRAGFSVRF